jgi:hypothetical protein
LQLLAARDERRYAAPLVSWLGSTLLGSTQLRRVVDLGPANRLNRSQLEHRLLEVFFVIFN